MANTSRNTGAIPVGTLNGSPWWATVRAYQLDGSHAAIAVGDLVQMTADGYLDVYAAGETGMIGACVAVLPATATTVLGKLGDNMLSNTEPTLSGAAVRNSAANATDIILVTTGAEVIYEMQEDGLVDPLELADVGANVEIINAGVDSTSGNSQMMLDSSSHAATNTLPLQILGLAQRPDNEYIAGGQAYTRWLVVPANHHYRGLSVGL